VISRQSEGDVGRKVITIVKGKVWSCVLDCVSQFDARTADSAWSSTVVPPIVAK
jgi:hypothetical protein